MLRYSRCSHLDKRTLRIGDL